MAYATLADLQARTSTANLTRLTTTLGDAPALDQVAVGLALADASAEADSYISRRTPVPLPMVPQALVVAVCAIALYELYTRTDGAVPPEEVKDRALAARKWLRDVAEGTVNLGLSPVAPTAPADASSARFGGPGYDRLGGAAFTWRGR